MDDGAMVVSMIAILCGTGVMLSVIHTIRVAISGRGKRTSDALVGEVRELREEIRQLRQQNNDLILTLDNSHNRTLASSSVRASSEVEQPLRRG